MPQLINRSDWRMVTSQSLDYHGPDFFYWREIWFVVDRTIEDAPISDAESRLASAIVSELRVHAAENIVELFVQNLLSCKLPQFLTQGS
ncbi:hypothetical protein TNCV_3968641 [Trichonephila clavipes]|nr:hypothetical protein TNCV_3968641 [Trichonephila clavipes]